MAALIAVASCDPSVIAPLPSPNTPDQDNIAVSSLGLTTDDNERLIALVGFDGAVEGEGELVVYNPRTDVTERFATTEVGSFSAALYGRAGDELELSYAVEEGGVSEPVTIAIQEYVEPIATGGGQPEPSEGAPPAVPGSDSSYDFCTEEPDHEDCGLAGEGDEDGASRLDVVWSYDGARLTIYGDAGFTSPNANVVVANNASGAVHLATADDTGAVIIQVPALTGDQILMFSQSPTDPSLTSPAIHFTVPATGGSGGTNAAAIPTPDP